jgi:cytochrome c biogenesis protein CcmG/thiol:disulfide interchange protein DsbE
MLRYLAPLIGFVVLAGFLFVGLGLDPKKVPSPLVGKTAPEFQLTTVRDATRTISLDDLKGNVSLLNVWATWCVSCRAEHNVLMDLARREMVDIYGLNYKDVRADAVRWLDALGDPYVSSAFDPEGRIGIDWGVYGTPETFVLDRSGVVRYKHIGPISEEDLSQAILPLVRELRAEKG